MTLTSETADLFPTVLRTALRERQMSQEEFARKIGRSSSAVSNWLRGRRPDLAIVLDMEDALNLGRGQLAKYLGYADLTDVSRPSWQDKLIDALAEAPMDDDDRTFVLEVIRRLTRHATAE